MQLVTRTQWGAPATTPAADMPTGQGVDVHWIGGPYTTPTHSGCAGEVYAIRQEHLNDPVQHWVDIAYNFVVCQHGVVFEGRGLHKESGANGNQTVNRARYAVCAIQGTNETAGDTLKNGLRDAIEYLQANGAGGQIKGHRDDFNTDCPGDELYAWVQAGAPRPGGSPAPQPVPAPSPQPQPNGPQFGGRVLINYCQGDDVRVWQQQMAHRGWTITVDGEYGPKSAAVCKAFQEDSTAHGWPLTDDSEVGEHTWFAAFNRPVS